MLSRATTQNQSKTYFFQIFIAQEREKRGDKIIIIGDRKHDEVRGIAGHLKGKAIIIENPENIPLKRIKKISKAAVVVQSTQNLEKVMMILEVLKLYIKWDYL